MSHNGPTNVEQLFANDPATGAEQLRGDLLVEQGVVNDDPNPGPSVNLQERAQNLIGALTDTATISRQGGYRAGAEIGPIRRRLERGGKPVDKIAGLMTDRQPRLESDARLKFGRAFGSSAMHGAGMTMEEAERQTNQSFEEFKQKYSGAAGKEKRNQDRDKLKRLQQVYSRPPKVKK